ncbi:hypothetical protein M0812_21052 [Anaeramoeba flamelloides]|uniref:Uncharacterized protein n=1 Tax=Anaeramoeba flamelloides TaxID=1746091 RepID=A0AAV7YQR2_9EUKA|nr:hypothetical protein M0812_21052 [Anaeramoeba flamelloides]
MFGTYQLLSLPSCPLKGDEKEQVKDFEKFLLQSTTNQKTDLLLLSPPTHSNEFFDKSIFLKNSKFYQETEKKKEEPKINNDPKKLKILVCERVKMYMKRSNLGTRECAILSNVPGIINNRNGVVCSQVIERVESYLSGKYRSQHYDQLFRRWLISRRDSDWKESKKRLSRNKAKNDQKGKYHFENYTTEEIRMMIKKVIEKSKKTEYKLSQSRVAAIVNVDEFRFRNVKYTMQKYFTGKSSSKDHLLDRKFYDWLSLRGKLLPPLSKRSSIAKQNANEDGAPSLKVKKKKVEIKNRSLDHTLKRKIGKEKEVKKHLERKHKLMYNDNNSDSDRNNIGTINGHNHAHRHGHGHGHGHRHRHKHVHRHHNHKQTSKSSKKINAQDNLEDLVQNLRSHQRKTKNKLKKKKRDQKHLKKKKRHKKKKFYKTHYDNKIDHNFSTKFTISTTKIPTLRAGDLDYNTEQIKHRKRKPRSFEKKSLKKKTRKFLNSNNTENYQAVFCD